MKTSSSTRLVVFDLDSEQTKQRKTLYSLPQFKRDCQVKITDGLMSCSCNFKSRFGIDCPHVYHVVSQSKEFKERSHHHPRETSKCNNFKNVLGTFLFGLEEWLFTLIWSKYNFSYSVIYFTSIPLFWMSLYLILWEDFFSIVYVV